VNINTGKGVLEVFEMKQRTISAAVGLALFAVVMIFQDIVFEKAIFVISLIGMREFYSAVERAGYRPLKTIGYSACLPLLFIGHISFVYIGLFSFVILVILMSFMVFANHKYNIKDAALTIFGVLYVAFLFSLIILVRRLDNGKIYIWLAFGGAWVTDTFAFFTGRAIGRKKIVPEVSPKKTVAGFAAGIVGCMLTMFAAGAVVNSYIYLMPVYHYAIMGLICGYISQLGDWGASAIKRYTGIKDFGCLMPGHGGALDRFDSVLLTAPVIYFYVSLII
jgi:phosphatidate cytidylyltransferase